MISGEGGSGKAVSACIAVVLVSSIAYWGIELTPRWSLSSLPSVDIGGLILLLPSLPHHSTLLHPPQHIPLQLRPCPTFLHVPLMFSYPPGPLAIAVVVLFIFVVVPIAEHLLLCHACIWYLISDPPFRPWSLPCTKSLCVGDWPQCRCRGWEIGGYGISFEVMADGAWLLLSS